MHVMTNQAASTLAHQRPSLAEGLRRVKIDAFLARQARSDRTAVSGSPEEHDRPVRAVICVEDQVERA